MLFCVQGMLESMLEPHLIAAGANRTQIGLSFLILGAVYMLATPFGGLVSLFQRIAMFVKICILTINQGF